MTPFHKFVETFFELIAIGMFVAAVLVFAAVGSGA